MATMMRLAFIWSLISILPFFATACQVPGSSNACFFEAFPGLWDFVTGGVQVPLFKSEADLQLVDESITVYEVRPSKNKGLGVFAKHSLKIGTVIIIENPLFAIPLPEMVPGQGFKILDMITSLEAAYDGLSSVEQRAFTDLHDFRFPSEENQNRLLTIFRSNAYNTGDSRVGLFPKIARINHSCTPNSGNEWVEGAGHRVIYASRDVKKGEEITVSYIPLLKKTADRQSRLGQYGFTCDCSACQSGEGDKRRTKIADLLENLEMKSKAVPNKKAATKEKLLVKALNLMSLVEEEGLNDYLSRAQHLAAVFSQRRGNLELARKYAAKELAIQLISQNPEGVSKTRDFIAQLNKATK